MLLVCKAMLHKQDRQYTYNIKLRCVRASIVAVEKNMTYSECVSAALVIQHALCLRHHLWPVRLYSIVPHYLINGTISEKEVTENKMCFDFLYKFYLKYFSF